MLSGVALALSELPSELIARQALGGRIHDRGGEREVQFLFAEAERLLPVWRNGQLLVLRWGNRTLAESRHPQVFPRRFRVCPAKAPELARDGRIPPAAGLFWGKSLRR